MATCETVLGAIGRTPLIALRRICPPDWGVRLYGKAEMLNPGGSVKDRIALAMVEAAEAAGELAPGATIIEATAGNTGVGLAMVAAVRGYACKFVMPEKMSEDKARLLRAYGAEVIRTANAPPSDPRNFQNLARRLAAERGWWLPDQFANPANPRIHELGTGREIWEDLAGEVTAFVAGVGTGGSLTGVARALKSRDPQVQIILADPKGSILHGGPDGAYELEGIGSSKVPANYDAALVDGFEVVTDREAFAMCRRMAREEGLLVGGAAGCAVVAARRRAEAMRGTGATIVAMLPDTGRNYLSKIFDEAWLAALPEDEA